jgi:glycosyltransferase involved in cell wall biosynthesis
MNVKFIFWLQDLTGYATYLKLGKKIPGFGHAVGRYYGQLEKTLLKNSDHIVAISSDFMPILGEMGLFEDRISIIQNWAPLDEVKPNKKDNPWAQLHGFNKNFIFLYTGILEMKKNPALLILLANSFRDTKDVTVFVVSESKGAVWLKRQKKESDLHNLYILNYQPLEAMSDILGYGDVIVAILGTDAGVYSVPYKIFTYICSLRPLLLSVPPESLVARIVKENKLGVVVPPGQDERFIEAARELYENSSLRYRYAQNARRYAEQNFDIEKIAVKFLKIIQD